MNELNVPRGGDWYCGNCHDLQFARNDKCRRCGTARTEADMLEGGTPSLPDPEAFLERFDIDPDKKERFLQMDRGLQNLVIAKGSLEGARDATAVLVKRMK